VIGSSRFTRKGKGPLTLCETDRVVEDRGVVDRGLIPARRLATTAPCWLQRLRCLAYPQFGGDIATSGWTATKSTGR
jgi:hypothetical protein